MNSSWLPTLFIGLLLLCIAIGEAKYTILIDAGSQGNRVYIYKYSESSVIETITDVAHKRARPALSSYIGDYTGLQQQMNFLVSFAKQIIPQECWEQSTISLKATAGMRAVPLDSRIELMRNVSSILSESGFRFISDETKVISGSEEALFGYLAIYIAFVSSFGRNHSMWAADLGGVSQQIAFAIPSLEEQLEKANLLNNEVTVSAASGISIAATAAETTNTGTVLERELGMTIEAVEEAMIDQLTKECGADYQFTLPTLSSNSSSSSYDSSNGRPHQASVSASVFTKSIKNLGLIAAMNQVIEFFKEQQQRQQQQVVVGNSDSDSDIEINMVEGTSLPPPNPCLHPGTLFPFESNSSNDGNIYDKEYMLGSGHFDDCVALIQTVFARDEDVRHVSKCVEEAKLRHIHQQHLLYDHLGLSDADARAQLFGPASHSRRVVVAMDNFPKVLEVMRKRGVLLWGRADADDDLAFIASARHMDDMLQDHCGVAGGATASATADDDGNSNANGSRGDGSWDIALWVTNWWRGFERREGGTNCPVNSHETSVSSGDETAKNANDEMVITSTSTNQLLLQDDDDDNEKDEEQRKIQMNEKHHQKQQEQQLQLASLFVSPRQIREAGRLICQEPWDDLLSNLGAEFESTPYRAQRACFGASFVYSILTSVLGIEEDDKSSFLPVEMHVGYTLGWPLGAALHGALGLGGREAAGGAAASVVV